MKFFRFFKKEKREFKNIGPQDELSKVLNGEENSKDIVTKDIALQIPGLKGGISFIADLVSSLEIKFYKEIDGKVESVDDYRLNLLNKESGDTLNSFHIKHALVRDFILYGNAYLYVNKYRNIIKSLHYVDAKKVSILPNYDPIFKDGKILVNGKYYDTYEFVIFTQNTLDGLSGEGLLSENSNLLELTYNTLAFSSDNIAAGGIKRGVVKSAHKLGEGAMDALKKAWSSLYNRNVNKSSTAIILNDGLDFHELSQTSTELEILNTRKNNDLDILSILKIPASVMNGTASNDQYNNFIKSTIIPLLEQLADAFNKTLLLETEKEEGCFFEFDTRDLLKGNVKERFETYKVAIESGIMTPNECRYQENLDAIEGMDIIKMSLGHIIYNTETKELYTPNTGEIISGNSTLFSTSKEVNEDGNKIA